MQIGPYSLRNNLFVAPMAGVTDRPYRQLCRHFGAGYAVSEMITANNALWDNAKTRRRMDHEGEPGPIAVQIAGSDPAMMAQAARLNVELGAQIIDINMGCPAKKVCNKLAGSALLKDEALVGEILDAVVASVNVPVTLKTRLGFCNGEENILRVAQRAQAAGIAALAVHGRTREDMYNGGARYDLIREVKRSISIPVIANGDITTPQKAREVLAATGADAIMVGRAAQGRPWLFREIGHFLATGEVMAPPAVAEIRDVLDGHLDELYAFYGEYSGCRIARKHIAWYTKGLHDGNAFRQAMYQLDSTAAQHAAVRAYFDQLAQRGDRLVYEDDATGDADAAATLQAA